MLIRLTSVTPQFIHDSRWIVHDTDRAFMTAEIIRDQMYFNAISRLGQTVGSGVLTRRKITP
ncbi:MAG: hypothetical protein Q8Q12_11295 [bacterium]|nr:hypothetical protein [bacterium]